MKLFLFKPTDEKLLSLIGDFKDDKFTHQNIGSTKTWAESSFEVLANSKVVDGDLLQFRRKTVGAGEQDFMNASQAIRRAVCFDLGWLKCHRNGDFDTGDVFSLTAKAFGIWTSSFCRVVYINEQETETGKLFSLGLGTLPCHAASGEERFSVSWNRETDEVDFMIGSFSRPQTWLTKMFVWYLRREQNRFATDSANRIAEEIASLRKSGC